MKISQQSGKYDSLKKCFRSQKTATIQFSRNEKKKRNQIFLKKNPILNFKLSLNQKMIAVCSFWRASKDANSSI